MELTTSDVATLRRGNTRQRKARNLIASNIPMKFVPQDGKKKKKKGKDGQDDCIQTATVNMKYRVSQK